MTIRRPTKDQLHEIADTLGLDFDADELGTYHEVIAGSMGVYDVIDELPDYLPPVRYPRTPGYRPEGEENKYGAWYFKTSVKGKARGKLAGKRIALKDTICLAGVPLMDGASSLEGYVPDVDAEIVNRILDAGGEIAGKAVCEYFSYSGGSHTAATGHVHNPHKMGYALGGSSSGCAVLVATGEVDMAMGGDQAGSIRVPATHSGIYGLKPTYGLVPYSGILSSEFNVDHTGPMTATVADNALLLEVVAGADGVDPRQRDIKIARYRDALAHLATRITVVEDPDFTAQMPAKRPAQLTIKLNDGTELSAANDYIRGDPEAPLSPNELRAKFDWLTAATWTPATASSIWQTCLSLSTQDDVSALIGFLARQ